MDQIKQKPETFLGQSKHFRIGIKKLLFVLKVIKENKKGSQDLQQQFIEIMKLVGGDQSSKTDALTMLSENF